MEGANMEGANMEGANMETSITICQRVNARQQWKQLRLSVSLFSLPLLTNLFTRGQRVFDRRT
jgi:hypothetical protein